MELLTEVKSVVEKINQLHPEDPKIYEYWELLARLLSEDENATISMLNNLMGDEIIEDISSVFDDVSRDLQSADFIFCIESIGKLYPELMIDHMVKAAKDALD